MTGPGRSQFDPEPAEPGHLYQLQGGLVSCTCGWSKKLIGWRVRLAYRVFEAHLEQVDASAREWAELEDENGCWKPKA